jgi:endonuclease III
MVATHRPKAPDKQDVCRKVAALLKKTFTGALPKRELPVLETLIYAVCLENATLAQADAVYARLHNAFHDLNEVRVSSITELQAVFTDIDQPDWRALRIKSALQYVFETNYSFDFDTLKRKSSELAVKQLAKIPSLSYFVRAYVMQHCLGSHVLPIDTRMHAALVWLGLAEPQSTPEQAGDALRSHVRKADATLFCHLVHCLATDPKRMKAFTANPSKPLDPHDAVARLDQLLRRGDSGGAKSKPSKESRASKEKSAKPARNGSHKGRAAPSRAAAKKRR